MLAVCWVPISGTIHWPGGAPIGIPGEFELAWTRSSSPSRPPHGQRVVRVRRIRTDHVHPGLPAARADVLEVGPGRPHLVSDVGEDRPAGRRRRGRIRVDDPGGLRPGSNGKRANGEQGQNDGDTIQAHEGNS